MLKKWNRIGATVIDLSIIMVLFQLIFSLLLIPFGYFLAFRGGGQPIELVYDIIRIFVILFIFIVVAVGYNYLLYLRFKSTLGKMLLRVHIVDEDSTSNHLVEITKKQLLKREIYKWTLSIGTLWLYNFYILIKFLLYNDEGYHNKIAHTKVEVWV